MKLNDKIFTNENAAREHLESLRWPHQPICPLCGATEKIKPVKMMSKPSKTNPEPQEQKGWYHCGDCRRKFTVRTGTIYERSHVPLNTWVLATHLLCSSKKGMSAHQLHRMLGVTYKTAWFMAHRIREAMQDSSPDPMGGPGKTVQADETYFGKKKDLPKTRTDGIAFKNGPRGMATKFAVVSLVSDGKARTFHVERADADTVRNILVTNASRDSQLVTDESRLYVAVGKEYAGHETVHHTRGQYVNNGLTTNNVENYFSVFKRGMKGVYQHCSEKHLGRYLAEFDFRYNNRDVTDFERSTEALKGAEDKRLTYRRIGGRVAAQI